MVSTRKHISNEEKANAAQGSRRPLSNYNYDEAVLKVQEWNEALKCRSCPIVKPPLYNLFVAPSRPSKHPNRGVARSRPPSPSPPDRFKPSIPTSLSAVSSSSTSVPSAWKMGSVPKQNVMNLVEKIQPSFALRTPEEQTDNWDDDFLDLEGISFTKLQGNIIYIALVLGHED